MICSNCDTNNDEDARFCKNCGNRTVPYDKRKPADQEKPKPKSTGNPRWVDFSPEDFENLVQELADSGHVADPSNPFFDKNVVISLFLDSMNELEFWHCIARAGGHMKKNVSKILHFLVEGEDHTGRYVKGETGKSIKARELNDSGAANIEIIDEHQFLEFLGAEALSEVKKLGL
jgi:NAD-dependent DNA ligase